VAFDTAAPPASDAALDARRRAVGALPADCVADTFGDFIAAIRPG
jgi:hypothetical protein